MDQSLLVKYGQRLVDALDREGLNPEIAVWILDDRIDAWRLWMVPSDPAMEKFEFYRRVGNCMVSDPEIDLIISDVQFMKRDHRSIRSLRELYSTTGTTFRHISHQPVEGFFIPEGIILRMTRDRATEAA